MANVNASNADEQGEDLLKDRYAEYYSYFHGTWKIEITKDGETETRVSESRPSQGGTSISIGENHTALWGTNPANGQRVGVSYQEDGYLTSRHGCWRYHRKWQFSALQSGQCAGELSARQARLGSDVHGGHHQH